jgi:sec-independent protein translocase protein TatC
MSTSTGGRMPLLEHLRELRKRVVRSAAAIGIFAIVGWVYYTQIITTLAEPVCDLKAAQETGADNCGALYISGVLGPLNLHIKVALLTGILLAAPFWLYQLWAFIAPALHKKEKRNSILFIIAATPFFSVGAYFGYTILPLAIKVLFGFTPDALNNLVKFDDYLDFVTRTIFFFGLGFELPVFLVALNLIGAVSGKGILRPWRIWIFLITLFVAGFTPSPDPLSMIALAVPLILLYFMAGGIALLNDRRRRKKAERADSGS